MLRSKQYTKLYKKYNSLRLDQPGRAWFVATRAYNQVGIIIAIREWGKTYEKNLRKLWTNCR